MGWRKTCQFFFLRWKIIELALYWQYCFSREGELVWKMRGGCLWNSIENRIQSRSKVIGYGKEKFYFTDAGSQEYLHLLFCCLGPKSENKRWWIFLHSELRHGIIYAGSRKRQIQACLVPLAHQPTPGNVGEVGSESLESWESVNLLFPPDMRGQGMFSSPLQVNEGKSSYNNPRNLICIPWSLVHSGAYLTTPKKVNSWKAAWSDW